MWQLRSKTALRTVLRILAADLGDDDANPPKKIPAKLLELKYLVYHPRNKDLGGNSALDVHFSGAGAVASTAHRLLLKEPPKMVFGGVLLRLWRRAQFSMLHCRGIIVRLRFGVCDGRTRKCDEKKGRHSRLTFPCRHFVASRENNFRCHEPAEHNTRQSRKPAPETYPTP